MADDQSTSGYGYQTPFDSASDAHGIGFIVEQVLAQMHTIRLCKVKAVHTASPGGTVDVQLLVNQIDGASPPNSQARGVVYGVPYWRLSYGVWSIVADPAVGDVGVLLCCDRDISAVVSNKGAQSNPGSGRRFSSSDGLFLCFGSVLNAAPKASIALSQNGTIAVTDQKGNSIITAATGMTLADLNGNQVQMSAGQVNVVTSSFKVNGVPVTVP